MQLFLPNGGERNGGNRSDSFYINYFLTSTTYPTKAPILYSIFMNLGIVLTDQFLVAADDCVVDGLLEGLGRLVCGELREPGVRCGH